MNELEDNLFQQLAYACAEVRQAFARYVGMSQARMQLLTLVSHGEISHAALQKQLTLDGATVTRLVKQFEAEGVVNRRLDPADNRYTLVSLTASGQQIVAGLTTAHTEFQTQLLSGITSDRQEIMLSILERLRSNIRTLEEEDQAQDSTNPDGNKLGSQDRDTK